MRVDSHVHFWRLARGDYHWMTPDMTAILRDFGPDDLEPLMRAAGVDAVVLVQAAATVAETRFLLEQRSEEDTSALQSLLRITYAVFCLTEKHKHIFTT